MSHPPPPPLLLPIIITFHLFLTLLPHLSASLPIVLPNPDPLTIQQQQQPFHPSPSPPATIPSSPEQSAVAGCPLTLPPSFFPAVKSSCEHLRRDNCCPVLAAWLYSAYSETALRQRMNRKKDRTASYDMPMVPDDSETCVDGVEKVMRERGVELPKPNATCDVVYCYCGIRLHPLSCPRAFRVSDGGELVGDERVRRLERDCLNRNDRRYSEIHACSKCLNSLYKLKEGENQIENATKSDARTGMMRNRDCELMGLTWLLNKNRGAYMSTVTSVMRALMMNPEDSDPRSCGLNSDGMPLAVNSADIDGPYLGNDDCFG